MYCPRCGRQPVANELRFCSYCGFKLGVVKATLAEEEEARVNAPSGAMTQPGAMGQPVAIAPSHRNTNIGVILMSLGTVLTTLLSAREGLGLHRPGAALLLTICWAAILLLSSPIMKATSKLLSWGEPPADRLSTIKREMGFGATL